jgi:hypothetical protein
LSNLFQISCSFFCKITEPLLLANDLSLASAIPVYPLCLPCLSSCLASSYNVPRTVRAIAYSPSLVFLVVIPGQHASFIFSDRGFGPIYHYPHFLSYKLICRDEFLCLGLISKLPFARSAEFEPTTKTVTTSAHFSPHLTRPRKRATFYAVLRSTHDSLPLPPLSQNAAALHLPHTCALPPLHCAVAGALSAQVRNPFSLFLDLLPRRYRGPLLVARRGRRACGRGNPTSARVPLARSWARLCGRRGSGVAALCWLARAPACVRGATARWLRREHNKRPRRAQPIAPPRPTAAHRWHAPTSLSSCPSRSSRPSPTSSLSLLPWAQQQQSPVRHGGQRRGSDLPSVCDV